MLSDRSTSFRILVAADIHDEWGAFLKDAGDPQWDWIRVDFSNRPTEFAELLLTVDCILGAVDLNEEEYQLTRRLKLLQLPTAGYEMVDLGRAKHFGVLVANNGGANAVSVAEHVFLLILALYRNLLVHHNSVVNGSWINLKRQNLELAFKTLGIVGLGNVGKEVAVRAAGFKMKVIYHDIRRRDPEFESLHNLEYRDFAGVMRESDIVTFHVPVTSKTRNMINAESLSWMRPNSILINTSRGEIQDEEALYQVLVERRIAGAGLDVFRQEPLPRNSPLATLDNVILTPHCGPSRESQFKMIENVARNVVRVSRGEPPLYLVVDYD